MDVQFIFDSRFEEAFFHEKLPKVWGARLLPFSYWHKIQLERAQSPLLVGGNIENWDIWIARQICRSQFPKAAQIPSNPSSLWYLFWYVLYGWRNLQLAVNTVVKYIGDYAAPPKLWSGSGSAMLRLAEAYAYLSSVTGDISYMQKAAQAEVDANASSKARDIDDALEQVALYMGESGRPPVEAWNLPLGEIVWYNVCFLKKSGADIPVWTPSDDEAFARNKIERHHRISKMAQEMMAEFPGIDSRVLQARAGVKYWEQVIAAQQKVDRGD